MRTAAIPVLLGLVLFSSNVGAGVVVESRTTQYRVFGDTLQEKRTEYTSGDRQCMDVVVDGPGVTEDGHYRAIVRIDRKKVWEVNYQDSTYEEWDFDEFRSLPPLEDRRVWRTRMGASDTIAGVEARLSQYQSRIPSPTYVSTGDSVVILMDVWTSDRVPAELMKFQKSVESAMAGRSPGQLSEYGRIPVIQGQYSLRESIWASMSSSAGPDTAIARQWGLEKGVSLMGRSEVSSITNTRVPAEVFEIPKGFKKRPRQMGTPR